MGTLTKHDEEGVAIITSKNMKEIFSILDSKSNDYSKLKIPNEELKEHVYNLIYLSSLILVNFKENLENTTLVLFKDKKLERKYSRYKVLSTITLKLYFLDRKIHLDEPSLKSLQGRWCGTNVRRRLNNPTNETK
jgi:hypothetical protein